MYGLAKGYKRQTPIDFDDTAPATGPGAWEWQPDVVPFAVDLARLGGVEIIVDIGCGSGGKWAPYLDDFLVVGYDRAEIATAATAAGPLHVLVADLESGDSLDIVGSLEGMLLVCSDVIEHMIDPTQLLLTLRNALIDGAEALVLSTPARERSNWTRKLGPPRNPHHAQEWTLDELVAFMTEHGFTIDHAGYTRSNDHEDLDATCLIVATA